MKIKWKYIYVSPKNTTRALQSIDMEEKGIILSWSWTYLSAEFNNKNKVVSEIIKRNMAGNFVHFQTISIVHIVEEN